MFLTDLKTWILSYVWEAFGSGEPKSPFVHKQKSKGRKMQEQFCSVARIQNPCMGQQEPYGKNAVWFPPGEP